MKANFSDSKPFVSIVICTYNRRNLLTDCLNSIYAMTYPKHNFEVIVIDGGSKDGTSEVCQHYPSLRFATERQSGLANARNQGAELAKGSIIVYTDDDCIVDKNWLTCLVEPFQLYKNISAVGGIVLPLDNTLIPNSLMVRPALGLYDEGEKIKPTIGFITSNSAFKREVFESFRFNASLGVTRRGKLVLWGEDTELCRQLRSSGRLLIYTPFARVYHQINSKRVNVRYIVKHAIDGGLSQTRLYLKTKNSRFIAIRLAFGQIVQTLPSLAKKHSFSECYLVLFRLSTFFICLTGIDKLF